MEMIIRLFRVGSIEMGCIFYYLENTIFDTILINCHFCFNFRLRYKNGRIHYGKISFVFEQLLLLLIFLRVVVDPLSVLNKSTLLICLFFECVFGVVGGAVTQVVSIHSRNFRVSSFMLFMTDISFCGQLFKYFQLTLFISLASCQNFFQLRYKVLSISVLEIKIYIYLYFLIDLGYLPLHFLFHNCLVMLCWTMF